MKRFTPSYQRFANVTLRQSIPRPEVALETDTDYIMTASFAV